VTARITFLFFIFCVSALARDDYRSKVGVEIKGLKTNLSNECGWIAGLKLGRFLGKSNVHVGIGGYYGSPTGGRIDDENLYFAGFLFGYDGRLLKTLLFETSILFGYGRGIIKAKGVDETSYFVTEPNIGFGFGLGKGWRFLFVASYQYLSRANHFSGVSFGLKIDERTETVIKPSEP